MLQGAVNIHSMTSLNKLKLLFIKQLILSRSDGNSDPPVSGCQPHPETRVLLKSGAESSPGSFGLQEFFLEHLWGGREEEEEVNTAVKSVGGGGRRREL